MSIIRVLQEHLFLFYLLTAGLGLIIGSFLNVVIYRLPIMLKREYERDFMEYLEKELPTYPTFNLVFPRSTCPGCGKLITWWQNIPIFSFIFLKAKCFNCKHPISYRYPLVEFITGATSFFVVYKFGVSLETAAILILTWFLIAAIFIDIDEQLLPDNLTLPLIWLGLILNTNNLFVSPENAIIGAVAGYLSLWLVAKIYKLLRKTEGMGYGDFKLLAVFGAWLGWKVLPLIVISSSITALIIGLTVIVCKNYKFNQQLPFGPYLAISGWLMFFYSVDLKSLLWY